MHDIESEADVAQLVNQFYDRVRQDEALGPLFNDVAQVDWPQHIPQLIDFWSTILLGTNQYRGNPMMAHFKLGQKTTIRPAHFERWLALFTQTIESLFAGERAEMALTRAQSIAVVFQSKLYAAGMLEVPKNP